MFDLFIIHHLLRENAARIKVHELRDKSKVD
ncbi:hypothetical protein LXL04_021982, partial [Taraxacum kok-saghyz]